MRPWRVAPVLVLVVLVLTGCSEGGDPAAPSTAAPSEEPPAGDPSVPETADDDTGTPAPSPTASPGRRDDVAEGTAAIEQRRGRLLRVAAKDGGDAPYEDVQSALDEARPGDVVLLLAGTHDGPVETRRAGRPDAPIRIVGEEDASLVGDDDERLLTITHDWVTVEQLELTDADKLVWVVGASHVRLLGNHIHGSDGECVRLRWFASGNEIAGNRIEDCGREGFDGEDHKNGEGVYVGTAPEQTDRNPTDEPDHSDRNHVHDNRMVTLAECVDVKEAARDTLVEHNTCSGGEDPDGGGLSSRGLRTRFLANVSRDHDGAGIRLGGDTEGDGTATVVRDNLVLHNDGLGLKVRARPQQQICGNTLRGNDEGPTDAPDLAPERPCREG